MLRLTFERSRTSVEASGRAPAPNPRGPGVLRALPSAAQRSLFGVLLLLLLSAGYSHAGDHAPWPVDWDNWDDPALWVTVGNPNNGHDPSSGRGSVGYEYQISKYEVTAGQYTAFLNAVARSDPYGLYNTGMAGTRGCKIVRSGNPGSFSYTVAPDYANRPVNYVGFWDAVRFANWLQSGDTEGGAYHDIGSAACGRTVGAEFFIPTEDEWYKAAYHKNNGATADYYCWPTGTNSPIPGRDLTESTNVGNNANYKGTPYPIDGTYYTTLVGEFQLSASPYGTYDQAGNVWEWNEDGDVSMRGIGGGSFEDEFDDLASSTKAWSTAVPGCEGKGFRLVRVVYQTSNVIADWHGDYVGANKALDGQYVSTRLGNWGGTASMDSRATRHFSETRPLSPSSSYTTYSAKSDRFYGGYQETNYDTLTHPTLDRREINQSGTDDRIYVQFSVPGSGGQGHFVLAFLKGDFLNGGSKQTNYMDAEDTSLSISTHSGTAGFTIRYLLKDGGQYYLSEHTITTTWTTDTLTNPSTATTWAAYDPMTSLEFDRGAATFLPHTFCDVTGVGYYVENDNIAGGATCDIRVGGFSARANPSPAPEPATGVLMMLGMLKIVVGYRRAVGRRGMA